jgi:hypothetical protein
MRKHTQAIISPAMIKDKNTTKRLYQFINTPNRTIEI